MDKFVKRFFWCIVWKDWRVYFIEVYRLDWYVMVICFFICVRKCSKVGYFFVRCIDKLIIFYVSGLFMKIKKKRNNIFWVLFFF